jgi:hypothetical protein
MLYALRGGVLFGVALVAVAAAVLGPGAAAATANALFWLLGWVSRAGHALVALAVALVT